MDKKKKAQAAWAVLLALLALLSIPSLRPRPRPQSEPSPSEDAQPNDQENRSENQQENTNPNTPGEPAPETPPEPNAPGTPWRERDPWSGGDPEPAETPAPGDDPADEGQDSPGDATGDDTHTPGIDEGGYLGPDGESPDYYDNPSQTPVDDPESESDYTGDGGYNPGPVGNLELPVPVNGQVEGVATGDVQGVIDRLEASLALVGWSSVMAGQNAVEYARENPGEVVILVGSAATGVGGYYLVSRYGATAITQALANRLLSAGAFSASSMPAARERIAEITDTPSNQVEQQRDPEDNSQAVQDAIEEEVEDNWTPDDSTEETSTDSDPGDATGGDVFTPGVDDGGYMPMPGEEFSSEDSSTEESTEEPTVEEPTTPEIDGHDVWQGAAGGGL